MFLTYPGMCSEAGKLLVPTQAKHFWEIRILLSQAKVHKWGETHKIHQ